MRESFFSRNVFVRMLITRHGLIACVVVRSFDYSLAIAPSHAPLSNPTLSVSRQSSFVQHAHGCQARF